MRVTQEEWAECEDDPIPYQARWDVCWTDKQGTVHFYYTDCFEDVLDEHKPMVALLLAACEPDHAVEIEGVGSISMYTATGPGIDLRGEELI